MSNKWDNDARARNTVTELQNNFKFNKYIKIEVLINGFNSTSFYFSILWCLVIIQSVKLNTSC